MSSWLIGFVCANEMGSLWTIFFSIVRLSMPYGMFSSVNLGYLELCLNK
jgi:hypothetical protein